MIHNNQSFDLVCKQLVDISLFFFRVVASGKDDKLVPVFPVRVQNTNQHFGKVMKRQGRQDDAYKFRFAFCEDLRDFVLLVSKCRQGLIDPVLMVFCDGIRLVEKTGNGRL